METNNDVRGTTDRKAALAKKAQIEAELAQIAKRPLEDSLFSSTVVLTMALVAVFAVLVALYLAALH
jgi:hypothetical protein